MTILPETRFLHIFDKFLHLFVISCSPDIFDFLEGFLYLAFLFLFFKLLKKKSLLLFFSSHFLKKKIKRDTKREDYD
tara:strand:+ start:259 stop:489 length:231 start_codon:yes stop_codon:yes gene_type:complete